MTTKTKSYAGIAWTVEDVQVLRAGWTDEQAEAFLERNQKHLRDRLIEEGWDVMGNLIELDEAGVDAIASTT
jgi:hypothetical protein